jgi:hypothetical protein
LTATLWSSHINLRSPFIIVGSCFSTIGWFIQLLQVDPPSIRYFGLFAVAAGPAIIMPLSVVWLNNNLSGRPKKAVAVALQMGCGYSANFITSNMFIAAEAPRYPTAFKTGLAFTVVGLFVAVLFPALLARKNRIADRRAEAGMQDAQELEDAQGVRFRYTL